MPSINQIYSRSSGNHNEWVSSRTDRPMHLSTNIRHLTPVTHAFLTFANFRYVSITEQIDKIPPAPLTPPQQPAAPTKTNWFRKPKRKEDKNKVTRLDSPSKDTAIVIDAGNGFNSTASTANCSVVDGATVSATNTTTGNTNNTATSTPTVPTTSITPVDSKEEIQEKIKAMGLDFFSEDFEGVTVSSTRCLSCETVTEQKETMIDLSVPITDNMETVEQPNLFIQVSARPIIHC